MKNVTNYLLMGIVAIAMSLTSCKSATNVEALESEVMSSDMNMLVQEVVEYEDFDAQLWAELAFSPNAEGKVMITRVEKDENGQSTFTTRFEPVGIRTLKDRSETGKPWVYWGVVCGIFDSKKFYTYLDKLYGKKTYEIKLEATDNDCKNAYHRESVE